MQTWVRKLLAAFVALLVASSALIAIDSADEAANALSGSRFDPGYIISDSVFYDFGTMTVADIQRFLESKVSNCTAKAGPTCLRYYKTDIPALPADPGRCAAITAATGQTAAQLIYVVANACGINPRVLLVMLQKEQGLITSTNPTTYMYQAAMGYGCPDSNPAICGHVYSGLFNQVYKAAGQMRWYGNPKGSYTYLKPGKTIQRPYSTKSYPVLDKNGNVVTPATCGFASFLLQNQATANLYYYTPYAPNAAALKNLYSLGDSCSAYGNRNFWRYYWDWFGSPIGGGFLLKSATSDVFLIVNDTRYRVPDPDTLNALAPLGPVGTISQAYLDSFKLGQDLTRVFSSATGQYFFVDGSKRFNFSDCNQVASLGLDCSKAVQLTNSQISALAPGGTLTSYLVGQNGDRYLIQNGMKREILDDESLTAAAITLPSVSPLGIASFDFLPWGPPIALEGSLFTNRSNQNVGVISGGQYLELDPSVSAIADFAKWFRKSSGTLSIGGVSTITTGNYVTDIVAGPDKSTYMITSLGKRVITNPDQVVAANQIAQVSTAFLNKLPIDDSPLTAPVLVRTASDPNVYLLRSGVRRVVAKAAENQFLAAIGATAVTLIPEAAMDLLAIGQPQLAPATLVSVKGKPTLSMIDGLDRRLKISSLSQAQQFGLAKTTYVSVGTQATYQQTADISGLKVQCGDQALVAVDGTLHPINAGWSSQYPGNLPSLDKATCLALKTTSSQIGRFLLTPDGKYWLVNGATKRLLTGKTQYLKLRGNGPAALKVSSAFAGFLATAKPVAKSAATPLNLPTDPTNPTPTPTSTPTPSASPTVKPTPSPTATPTAKPTPSPTPTPAPVRKYTVIAGDTLTIIAKKFGTTVSAIVAANKLSNANTIHIGQVLIIP